MPTHVPMEAALNERECRVMRGFLRALLTANKNGTVSNVDDITGFISQWRRVYGKYDATEYRKGGYYLISEEERQRRNADYETGQYSIKQLAQRWGVTYESAKSYIRNNLRKDVPYCHAQQPGPQRIPESTHRKAQLSRVF